MPPNLYYTSHHGPFGMLSKQASVIQMPSNPNIRFGDMRYTPDQPTIALIDFLKSTREWEEIGGGLHSEGRGTLRYKLRAGAANFVRYTQFYHYLRSKYMTLHPSKSFDVTKIFDELRSHLNQDYTLEMQEGMARVWCLLSQEIEKEARHDFFASPSKFPLKVQLGTVTLGKFLGILIDLVISDLVPAPHHFKDLRWNGLDEGFYERAMAGELHQGFFAWPVIHPDVPT